MNKLLVVLPVFLMLVSSVNAAGLNLGGIELGSSLEQIQKQFPDKFECKTAEGSTSKSICKLPHCSFEDPKCNLWGAKSLSMIRVYAAIDNKKLSKMIVDLDYLTMSAREAKNVLSALEKNLGKAQDCPLQKFLEDPKATHGDESCNWKSGGVELLLYTDDGRMKLKLEKAE